MQRRCVLSAQWAGSQCTVRTLRPSLALWALSHLDIYSISAEPAAHQTRKTPPPTGLGPSCRGEYSIGKCCWATVRCEATKNTQSRALFFFFHFAFCHLHIFGDLKGDYNPCAVYFRQMRHGALCAWRCSTQSLWAAEQQNSWLYASGRRLCSVMRFACSCAYIRVCTNRSCAPDNQYAASSPQKKRHKPTIFLSDHCSVREQHCSATAMTQPPASSQANPRCIRRSRSETSKEVYKDTPKTAHAGHGEVDRRMFFGGFDVHMPAPFLSAQTNHPWSPASNCRPPPTTHCEK